jgi:hypothetical protein
VNADLVVAFLRCLLKELPGHILIVWDRFQPHRSRKVQKLLLATHRLHYCFLPPYAPELNPAEYVWAYTKMNPLANLSAMELNALATETRSNMRSLQRKHHLLHSFLKKSGLSLRLK